MNRRKDLGLNSPHSVAGMSYIIEEGIKALRIFHKLITLE